MTHWETVWKVGKPLVPVILTALGVIGAQNTIPAVKRMTDFNRPSEPAVNMAQFEAMQLRILAEVRKLPPAKFELYVDNVKIKK